MSNPRYRELREKALKGGTRYLAKLREQNKLTARERLDLLLDKGSFIEDGLYANVLAEELPADGVVTGLGTIDGRQVAVMANDPTVKAGSWGARTVEEIVYREELNVLERRNRNFHVLYTLTRPVLGSWEGRTGRIGVGGDLLTEAAAGLDRPVYYLCGAPGFIEACFRSLVSSGVAEADIRFEIFRGYGATA